MAKDMRKKGHIEFILKIKSNIKQLVIDVPKSEVVNKLHEEAKEVVQAQDVAGMHEVKN